MARASTQKPVAEQCWILVGRRLGPFWHARRTRRTSGDPASVSFQADWVLSREEVKGDVLGFYHTHPAAVPGPSQRDDHTMRAWVGSFGKPLLCLIEADRHVTAYLYSSDDVNTAAVQLTACELFPRGVVIVYDEGEADHGE